MLKSLSLLISGVACATLCAACSAAADAESTEQGNSPADDVSDSDGKGDGLGNELTDDGREGEDDDSLNTEEVSFAEAAQHIEDSCGSADCHGGKEELLIVNDETLKELLLGTVVEECGNLPLVTPGEPDKSAILLLVERKCGELFMPDNCRKESCLPLNITDDWRSWISSGAAFD